MRPVSTTLLLTTAVLLAGVATAAAAKSPPRPDLAISSVTLSTTTAIPGATLTASAVLRNSGRAAAPASTVRAYLSSDRARSKSDAALGGAVRVPALTRGKRRAVKVTRAIPTTTADGPWFVLVCADATNKLREASETNQCSASPALSVATPVPDPETPPATITPPPPAPIPALTISDVSVAEGDAGTTALDFVVTASLAPTSAIELEATMAAVTVIEVEDYAAFPLDRVIGTLDAGATFEVLRVLVKGDLKLEGDETFTLTLETPTGATVSDAEAIGTVTNDDEFQVVGATAVDNTTVRVYFNAPIQAVTIEPDGSQFTFDNGLVATAATQGVFGNDYVDVTTTAQSMLTDYSVTVAGTLFESGGTSLGVGRNVGSFTGFVPVAELVINEVAPKVTSSQDIVELRALTAGSIVGAQLQESPYSTAFVHATLPDVIVSAGDIIVVHYTPGADVTTETTGRGECANVRCYAGAWDVAATSGAVVTFTRRVLGVTDAGGYISDVVPFYSSGAGMHSAFVPNVIGAQSAGEWLPADCGGQACDYFTAPSVDQISVDWTLTGTTPSGDTVRRDDADSNMNADWAIAPSSLGAPNP